MEILVKNAYANNLKNISTNFPIGEITALTGLSGSGKSTLLKDILGAYGAKNFTYIASKTVKNALLIKDNVEVDEIENLPNTILIDVKNSVSNPISTVSTISGIHVLLRNLFIEYGEIHCKKCGAIVYRDYSLIHNLFVDLKIDDRFEDAICFIKEHGAVKTIEYFDKNGIATTNEKKRVLATIYFSLKLITEKLIKDFNKQFDCSVYAVSEATKSSYNFIKEIECAVCHTIGPNLIRSRLSYNTPYKNGGGACRYCNGTGKNTSIKTERIFQDKSKGLLDGASQFINANGIKHTTVSERFLCAVFNKLCIDIATPVEELPDKAMNTILYGMDSKIVFKDKTGGQKELFFEGITVYLDTAYREHKGGVSLSKLFDETPCSDCRGSRFDSRIRNLVFGGESVNSLMEMTLNELRDWCVNIKKSVPKKAQKYLDKIIKETTNFDLLSCGHLELKRVSNSLSGGELQRIRVCTLLNSNIHGLCYLLDEPSSGLHYSDIEKLAVLLRKICNQGNTIIMVEHNKKMLSYCDHIVDMGPFGGKQGGNVLFNAPIDKIRNYDTATTRIMLNKIINTQVPETFNVNSQDFLNFKNLTYNNLKNISVSFPRNSFTVVCGVSGSGKTTFIKNAVLASIVPNPLRYGFDGVDYLGQELKVTTNRTTVASLIKIGDYIAKLFEKASKSKLKKSCFMLGSAEGKCQCCGGKGFLYSEAEELLGICDQCNGYGFNDSVLKIRVDGLNIFELYNMNLEDIGNCVKDLKIKALAEFGNKLGVGYLTLARKTKSLSKGELQRVSLIQILLDSKKNHLLILDEPSKGLHVSDTEKLVSILHKIANLGNTVLIVEHNPEMIRNSDYVIEFGGTGVNGGYLLYQGKPEDITDTPTAKILKHFEVNSIGHTCKGINEITIIDDDDEIFLRYAPYSLYYDSVHIKALLKAAKKSKDDFLSVAIPNNSMFSKLDRNIIETDTPILLLIDFKEKLNYNISVSEALNIRHFLCETAATENTARIARYVFDTNSITGKCLTCSGTGKAMTVNMNYFLEEGELNAACKKFLKNSTDYTTLSKLLKRDGIDITKSIKFMSSEEKTALFWGTDLVYIVDSKTKRWEGIIPYFIQFHKYYPDNTAVYIFKEKTEVECPICKNERLKTKYLKYKCYGLTYREWMTLPISSLFKKINTAGDINLKNISKRLAMLCNMGLNNLTLSDELVNMDVITSAKIKLLSFYFNRIHSIGLIVNNLNYLDRKERDIIKDILEGMTSTNTVWIVG